MSDFWSRRRGAVAEEARVEEAAREADLQQAQENALAERPDEEILEELGLPNPEEMERPEQVQALLKAAVPQRLKSRALRRLWRLNPVLANLDGLVDYGEDFTDAATVVENLQTAYQVGKGMLKALVEDDDRDVAAPDPGEAPDAAGGAPATDPATDPTPGAPAPAAPAAEAAPALAAAATTPEDDIAAPYPAAPRRMRFRFEAAN